MKATKIAALIASLTGLALAQSSSAWYASQPTPQPCAGMACADSNTTLRYQDTTIVRRPGSNGRRDLYFRFSKGDYHGDGINVATSYGLSGVWNYTGTIINDVSGSECVTKYKFNNTDLNRWAPEVHFINGLYYLFYTVEDQKLGRCFDLNVATSPTMEVDSWTNHGSMGIKDFNTTLVRRIDGTVLADVSDPQGAVLPIMAYGSWQDGIYAVELTDDYLKGKTGGRQARLIAPQNQPGGSKTEGAYLLRRNGYIYLFYSRGSCCSGRNGTDPATVYLTQVCRTNSTTPWGPYYDRDGIDCTNGPANRTGTTILANTDKVWEPGSVSVLQDPKEGLVMTYQFVHSNPASFLAWSWNYLTWREDWPVLTQTR